MDEQDFRKEFSEIVERMMKFVACSYLSDCEAACHECCCRSSFTGRACVNQMKIDFERLGFILEYEGAIL